MAEFKRIKIRAILESDVVLITADQIDRLVTARAFAQDAHPFLRVQDIADPLAEKRMIVDNDDADWVHKLRRV